MWTNEQLAAINARNVSVIVSAAAGSGKTSVLVERLTRLLADEANPVPANKMIVVTFTNDATAEMKYRLSKELSRMISENPENSWLVNQQSLLQCAKISTINSFCFDLIRENIQNVNVASGFRIIDEAESNIIIHNCVEDTLEYAYVNMPEKAEMLYKYFCDDSDKKLENILIKIYKFIESIPYNDYWLKKTLEKFSDNQFKDKLLKEFNELISKKLSVITECAKTAYNIISDEADGSKAFFILEYEYKALAETACSFNEKGFDAINRNITFETLRKDKNLSEDSDAIIKSMRKTYKKLYLEILDYAEIFSRYDDDFKAHYEITEILIELITIMKNKINEVKTSKNGLSFADGEQIVLNLLSDIDDNGNITRTALAQELSEYYDIIMVDEFQDSNDNQDLIFRLLSRIPDNRNCTSVEYGNNMFLVGDVKQAIYGFRQSNAKIFTGVMDKFLEYKEGTSDNSYIMLNCNFRSSAQVIGFVNHLFSRIMSRKLGDVEYTDTEKLVQGAEFADTDKDTEIALIEECEEYENEQAEWTAVKIMEMVENKSPVCERGGKSTRPCEYKDFCVLLRDNNTAAEYARILKSHGIPVYSEETSGYIESREISLMLNLLRVVNNPLIDVALASVMLSPMFSFTPDEITEIRLCSPDTKLYTALCMAAGEFKKAVHDENGETVFEKSEPLTKGAVYEKSIHFLKIINELRMYSATDTLEQLIRRIYERTDFLSVMQVYKDSEKKKANLRILIEYAKSYENSSFGGLSGFLRYIDRSIDIKSDCFKHGSTSSGSENAVSIKTMHKSKGLEFPFVFVCNTEKEFTRNNPNDVTEVQLDKEYGISFRLRNPDELLKYSTLPYEIIKEKRRIADMSEELRLLYVTLTRAKDKLFIPLKKDKKLIEKIQRLVSSINSEGSITYSISSSAASMSDWILMSLIDSKYSAPLCDLCDMPPVNSDSDEFGIRYTDFKLFAKTDNGTSSDKKEIAEEIYEPDSENIRQLKKSFEFFSSVYDFTYSGLPAKLSVSDIAKENNDFEPQLKRPKFIMDRKKLTGAESGTALHTFMQYCDFNRISEHTEDELNSCVAKGFISQKECESINPEKVKNFADSELFRRITGSDKFMRERKFMINLMDIDASALVKSEYAGKDIILQGIADIIFIENNQAVIVDYKTDYAKSEDYLINLYSKQLELYKLAFEKILGLPVAECIIYSFSLDKCIKIV